MMLMRDAVSCLLERRFEHAEELYARALDVSQRFYGDSHHVTASLLGHLARACIAQKDKEDFSCSLLERQVILEKIHR